MFDIGRVSDTLTATANDLTQLKGKLKHMMGQTLPTLQDLTLVPDIIKVAAIIIKDGKLLTARNTDRELFYAVGGKLEPGESEEQCLHREVEEEIGCKITQTVPYKTFEGMNYDNSKTLRMPCYLVQLEGEPKANNEIAELLWVSAESYRNTDKDKLANMLSNHIIPSLIQDKLL